MTLQTISSPVCKKKGPALSCEDMDVIETWWKTDMRNRRCALVTATEPFSQLEERVSQDREFAKAVASVLECLDVGKYEMVAGLLEDAKRRMMVALTARQDVESVIEEAKREIDQA